MSAISRDKKAENLHFTGVSLFRLNSLEFINCSFSGRIGGELCKALLYSKKSKIGRLRFALAGKKWVLDTAISRRAAYTSPIASATNCIFQAYK